MLFRATVALFIAAGVASTAGGELDPSFSGDGWVRTTEVQSGAEHYILSGVDDLAIQADGRLLVTGEVHSETTGWNFGVFRYLQDGSLDGSFAGRGWSVLDLPGSFERARAVAVQPDGNIVVGGEGRCGLGDPCFTLARFTTSGALDRSFGKDGVVGRPFGVVIDLAVQRDGRIVAAGWYAPGGDSQNTFVFQVARYLPDGRLDRTFSRDGWVRVDFGYGNQTVHALALQRDGRILVAGSGSRNWGATRDEFVVARLRPNGRLDRTFSRDGRARVDFGRTWGDWAQGLAVLRDGRIALVGSSARDNSPSRMALALLRPKGKLVWKRLLRPTRRGGYATDVVQAPDGSLVVGGRSFDGDSRYSSNWLLARFRLDGRLVRSFGRGGFVITDFGTGEDWIEELALQRDGKVVAAGALYGTQGLARYRLR